MDVGVSCLWETWLRNLNFAVRPEEGSMLSMGFFPSYFFYYFYQFSIRSWDFEVHPKFQHLFFVREIQCFLILKKTVSKFLQLSVTPNSNFLAKFLISRDTHIHWCSTVYLICCQRFGLFFFRLFFFCSGILNIDGNSRLTQPWKNIFPKLGFPNYSTIKISSTRSSIE